jgi:hypothetical protein
MRILTRKLIGIIPLIILLAPLGLEASGSFQNERDRIIENLSKREMSVLEEPQELYLKIWNVDPKKIKNITNRRELLSAIVRKVTHGAVSDLNRAKKWTIFLQDKIVHPKSAPLLLNGQAVYDPIWILTNKVAHCGQTNRLIVDGLEILGIKGRVVQIKNHVIAEVFINGNPIALDADLLDGGRFFLTSDGRIPSAQEIFENPKILDKLAGQVNTEYEFFGGVPRDRNYFYMMMRDHFSEKPFYYVKTAQEQNLDNEYYGWNYYKTIRD